MKKQLIGLALAAAWMGSGVGTVWAQEPATPALPTTPTAPAGAAAATMPVKRPEQVQGRVSAVDLTKKTVTVTGRRDPGGTTLTLSPDAKVLVTQKASLSDIKTGDILAAYAMDVTKGATAVTADRLVIMPAETPHGKPGRNAGYRRAYVQGTVANTAPSLTMTTPGGVTVTVTPAAEAPVTRVTDGALSDITVGANIQARTAGDAASPTATEIRILPAGERRSGGRRTRKSTPTVTAPAAPATPAPAPAAPANP